MEILPIAPQSVLSTSCHKDGDNNLHYTIQTIGDADFGTFRLYPTRQALDLNFPKDFTICQLIKNVEYVSPKNHNSLPFYEIPHITIKTPIGEFSIKSTTFTPRHQLEHYSLCIDSNGEAAFTFLIYDKHTQAAQQYIHKFTQKQSTALYPSIETLTTTFKPSMDINFYPKDDYYVLNIRQHYMYCNLAPNPTTKISNDFALIKLQAKILAIQSILAL